MEPRDKFKSSGLFPAAGNWYPRLQGPSEVTAGRRRGEGKGGFTVRNPCLVFSPVCCHSLGNERRRDKPSGADAPDPEGSFAGGTRQRLTRQLLLCVVRMSPRSPRKLASSLPPRYPPPQATPSCSLTHENLTPWWGGVVHAGCVMPGSKDGPCAASPGCPAAPGTGGPASLRASRPGPRPTRWAWRNPRHPDAPSRQPGQRVTEPTRVGSASHTVSGVKYVCSSKGSSPRWVRKAPMSVVPSALHTYKPTHLLSARFSRCCFRKARDKPRVLAGPVSQRPRPWNPVPCAARRGRQVRGKDAGGEHIKDAKRGRQSSELASRLQRPEQERAGPCSYFLSSHQGHACGFFFLTLLERTKCQDLIRGVFF